MAIASRAERHAFGSRPCHRTSSEFGETRNVAVQAAAAVPMITQGNTHFLRK